MDNWTVVEFLADRFEPARAGLIEAIADLDFIATHGHDSEMQALARSAAEVARLYLRGSHGTTSIK